MDPTIKQSFLDKGTEKFIKELSDLSRKLESLGQRILFASIFNLAVDIIYVGGNISAIGQSNEIVVFWGSLFSILLTILLVVFYLFQFERLKKKGDVIFDEISDELQWWAINKESDFVEEYLKKMGKKSIRPKINVRVILREYVNNSGLPLLQTANSTFTYLSINFVFFVISLFSSFVKIFIR